MIKSRKKYIKKVGKKTRKFKNMVCSPKKNSLKFSCYTKNALFKLKKYLE